jgi:hypothetical protein
MIPKKEFQFDDYHWDLQTNWIHGKEYHLWILKMDGKEKRLDIGKVRNVRLVVEFEEEKNDKEFG